LPQDDGGGGGCEEKSDVVDEGFGDCEGNGEGEGEGSEQWPPHLLPEPQFNWP